MRKVIVIGGNHHNTLGVIRALGRRGITPYVILTTNANSPFVARSKYIAHIWSGLSVTQVPEFLLLHFSKETLKPILIACNDANAYILDKNRESLSEYFIVPGTNNFLLGKYMNKLEMSHKANEFGLITPFSSVVWDGNINNSLPFPCITKSEYSNNGSKQDIRVFNDKESLILFLKNNKNRYNVQEFIDKDFEYQLIGCSLNNGEEIIIPGYSKLIRPGNGSNTGFLCYDRVDESLVPIITKSKHFLKSIGYNGLFSIEFLRGKDGLDYFMEINFRNDGNGISVTQAGVNLPYIWYLYNSGIDYREELKTIKRQYVMPEFTELGMWYSGLISWSQFRNDMKLADVYMDFDCDDKAPTKGWYNYCTLFISMLIKKVIKRVVSKLTKK